MPPDLTRLNIRPNRLLQFTFGILFRFTGVNLFRHFSFYIVKDTSAESLRKSIEVEMRKYASDFQVMPCYLTT